MSETKTRCVMLACACIFLSAASVALGVVNGVPVPAADKRFDAVGLFLLASPSVPCSGLISGTCTLVGPNVVLIARHSLDITPSQPLWPSSARQYRVRFRRNPAGLSVNSLWVNWEQCHGTYQEFDVIQLVDAQNPGCDQVLAYLSGSPVGIVPIAPVIRNAPIHPTDILLAGWGYAGDCFGSGDHWGLTYARGRLPDNFVANDYLAFSLCSVGTAAPCLSCAPFGGPYATANLHDSGAPVLIEVPSTDPDDTTPELRLIGTVGSANSGRRPTAWNNSGGVPLLVEPQRVVHIHSGDFDGNGQTGVNDIVGYLSAFFAGRLDADTNQDGVVEVDDLLMFIRNWFNSSAAAP